MWQKRRRPLRMKRFWRFRGRPKVDFCELALDFCNLASSPEFVGEFWLRQVSKLVI
jgi:hypothetical protein